MGMTVDVYRVSASEGEHLLGDPSAAKSLVAQTGLENSVSLEKAWHGLHFLLTGDSFGTSGPLAFICAGGADIPGTEGGYGPARIFSPSETTAIHEALVNVDDDALWSRFDPDAMTEQGVYPVIWDEPEEDLRDEYLMYFNSLKELVARAAAGNEALVVYLT